MQRPAAVLPAKYVAALVLMLVFGLAATGCRKRRPPAPRPSMRVLVLTSLPGGMPVVAAARAGLRRLATEMNAAGMVRTVGSEAAARQELRKAGKGGATIVFCLCPGLGGLLYEEAVAYPDTWFVLVPGRVTGPNIASITFAVSEAGYLAGAAAGAYGPGPTAAIVGAGREDPFFAPAERGFRQGFTAVSADRRVIQVDGAAGIAGLAGKQTQVVLDSSERAVEGVADACRKAGVVLVTADPSLAKEAPDVVLGTLEIDLPEAMSRVAQEVWAGTMEGKIYRFDLGSGVVGFELDAANPAAARPAVAEAVDRARADVTAGIVEIEELDR